MANSIIRNTTGDRFTAAVFDKLLSQGPEAVREALKLVGENGSSRDRPLCLDVDLPALQQLVKDMNAKNHKKQQLTTPAAAPGVLLAEILASSVWSGFYQDLRFLKLLCGCRKQFQKQLA